MHSVHWSGVHLWRGNDVAVHGPCAVSNPKQAARNDTHSEWFERLIRHAKTLYRSGKPVVLAGDLNVVPTDHDIYNASSWREDAVMQPETRDAYQRLLAQGWTDSTRHLHPKERIYTFWVNAHYFRRNAGFRMDFLLLNAELTPKLKEAGVDTEFRGREGASDHAPTWVTLSSGVAKAARNQDKGR